MFRQHLQSINTSMNSAPIPRNVRIVSNRTRTLNIICKRNNIRPLIIQRISTSRQRTRTLRIKSLLRNCIRQNRSRHISVTTRKRLIRRQRTLFNIHGTMRKRIMTVNLRRLNRPLMRVKIRPNNSHLTNRRDSARHIFQFRHNNKPKSNRIRFINHFSRFLTHNLNSSVQFNRYS